MILKCISCQQQVTLSNQRVVYSSSGVGLMEMCIRCNLGKTIIEILPKSGFRRFGLLLEFGMKIFRISRCLRIVISYRFRRHLSILDSGCGRGEFLSAMRCFGWNVLGTEYSFASSIEARAKNIPLILETDTDKSSISVPGNDYFDVITSFHNLEHLDDPLKFLNQSWNALKIDGLLIIEVPNIDSIQFHIAQENWLLLDLENHKTHFSRKSLLKIVEQAGFHVKNVSTFSMNYGILGMVEALRMKAFGKLTSRRRFNDSYQYWIGKPFFALGYMALCIPALIFELICSILGRGAVIRISASKRNQV